MTKCDVCKGEIRHGESHIGHPFVDGLWHMACKKQKLNNKKCDKCKKEFYDQAAVDRHNCRQ